MGFFKKIKKFTTKAVKATVKTVASPKKLTTAVLTGGLSVVAPKITKPLEQAVGRVLFDPQTLAWAASFTPQGRAVAVAGGGNMAFNVGGFLGAVGGALSGVSGQNAGAVRALGVATGIAGAALTKPGTGLPRASTNVMQVRPAMALAGPALRSVPTIGRSFFNRFPNLGLAIQTYRNAGKKVSRGKLYSLVRRFGPEIVISGGILTAAAVNELMIAGPGTRRMNPTNVKALRRSMRRIQSFHRLCSCADLLKGKSVKKRCR